MSVKRGRPVALRFALVACCIATRGVMTSSEVREKRSDDASPLQAVVDQLSQQVISLTADMASLKSKTASLDTAVAFYAYNSDSPVQTAAKGTVILNHAATNVGNAYDTMTGIFTAPVSGLYDFQASVLDSNRGPGEEIYLELCVQDQRVAIAVSDTESQDWDHATMKAIFHLQAGQRVHLKNPSSRLVEYFSSPALPYTAFSGFLIKAD